jgi:hypothetical protein
MERAMLKTTLFALVLAGALAACSDDDTTTPGSDAAPSDAASAVDASARDTTPPPDGADPRDTRADDATSDLAASDSTANDAGLSVTACLADVAPTRQHGFVNVLEFSDQGQTLHVGIAREPGDRPAVGETFPYDLKRFALAKDGASHCISDPGALSYDFGHHNWNDTAEAVIGTTRYELTMVYNIVGMNPAWDVALEALDTGSGSTLWGPIDLSKTSCRSVPSTDLNGCLMW